VVIDAARELPPALFTHGSWPPHRLARVVGTEVSMPTNEITSRDRAGKIHPIILFLLGVPIPVIILLFLIRGCMA
jgi:hypothetical protein